MLVGSTGPGGSLNTDAFQRAMLAYRNTPDPMSKVSPAEIIFGRRIRDFIPVPPGQYLPHWTWRETLQAREDALRIRHMRAHERLSEHIRVLPPLIIGNCVKLAAHRPIVYAATHLNRRSPIAYDRKLPTGLRLTAAHRYDCSQLDI